MEGNETITYILKDVSTGYYKIGKSNNISKRFNALSCGNISLKVAAYIYKDIEKELHLKYRVNRIKNEWFCFTDEEFNNIALSYGFYIPFE